MNFSPRAGLSLSVLREGRGILRGGFGKFAERTPLTVGAFTQYEAQTFTRYAADGQVLGGPIYNAFDTGNERDVQNNIASPDYGRFYNPIQRSIGFVVSSNKS